MNYLSNIDTILGILGIMYGIFSFFYFRKIKFYMFVSRIFKFNKTTEISVSYRFINSENITLKTIQNIFQDEKFSVMNGNTNNIIINMNDFIVQFHKDDFPVEEYGENGFIRMTLTRTYYKQAKKSIDKFINICEKYQKNRFLNDGTYNLKINYNNVKNPYLSASAHRIKEENIKNLILNVDTKFLIDDLNEEVIINKNSLSYTSRSSKNIYKIASDFMII